MAVVRAPTDIISFEGLRNATSCHSAYNDAAGWLYPVSGIYKLKKHIYIIEIII